MAKFFDLNKSDSASKEPAEKPEVKEEKVGSPEVKAEEPKPEVKAEKEVAPPIEHGSFTGHEDKEAEKVASDVHELKHERVEEKEDKPADDEPPKAPEIPRVTPSMAPEARPFSKPISSTDQLKSASGKQKWVTAILTIILLGLLGVLVWQAYIFYNNSIAPKASSTETTSTTPAVTKKTTATTTTTTTTSESPATTTASTTALTKDKVTVKVLNGNGVTGSASKASTAVKTAGFTVSSTANAKAYTYETTTVYYKTEAGKTVADQLVSALTGYTVASKLDATVATTETELVLVVGKK